MSHPNTTEHEKERPRKTQEKKDQQTTVRLLEKIKQSTFCILNNPFHQDRVLGDALGNEQDALLNTESPHNGTVADFLENKTDPSHPLYIFALLPPHLSIRTFFCLKHFCTKSPAFFYEGKIPGNMKKWILLLEKYSRYYF